MVQILSADHLSKHFGQICGADQVSLCVNSGIVLGLLGANGAGKTTVLRMIAGVLAPDRGRIPIAGIDLAEKPNEGKRKIGFHSCHTQLYQGLSTRESLRYFGRLYGMEHLRLTNRIDELIGQLEMKPFVDRPFGVLSSGQKQRANIARAFLHEPELLILDEPTSALDVVSGQFIIDVIRRQKVAGRAVLFSTHIMSEAERLCDRIALMHEGRIIDEGPLDALLARTECRNLTDVLLKKVSQADSKGAL